MNVDRLADLVLGRTAAVYLCYDIKGIQRFIFSVPKLKCVVGASGLIDEFDRQTARECALSANAEPVFSGGGRGAFFCATKTDAETLADSVVAAAHAVGLDVRIGIDADLSQAAHHADRLRPWVPDSLDGEPCAVSGLWPVPKGRIPHVKSGVHPLVWRRIEEARHDRLGKSILASLFERGLVPERLADFELQFFKTVSPEADDEDDARADEREARAAQAALGGRNRWAVVAMDGNDMGRQFLSFESLRKQQGWSDPQTREWLQCMSRKLDESTRESFLAALADALADWADAAHLTEDQLGACLIKDESGRPTKRLVLPFRPLILGGDDVTLLCHCSVALRFVHTMAARFREQSGQAEQNSGLAMPLWPATGGHLTISAGILYAKVTFPLHLAIPYAESLLASAKGAFRAPPGSSQPTPAAVDWDAITDTLVDTPAERRNRDLRFEDEEIGKTIELTRRPYVLEQSSGHADMALLLKWKQALKDIPASVRARILPSLQRPWSERLAFVASVAKRHGVLKEQLWEGDEAPASGWHEPPNGRSRVTGLPDALLLLEEEHRMARPTANG
jgi:hypothetical protein